MKIYTLTLNPAYDVHVGAESFITERENHVSLLSRDVGGKGINVSSALKAVGIESTAIVVLGDENCAEYEKRLSSLGLDCVLLHRAGRIRENITVHTTGKRETRISLGGFHLDGEMLSEILSSVSVDENTYFAFVGSVPEGISREEIKGFLSEIKSRGARLIIDSRSVTLKDLTELSPWLIKPNGEEMSAYLGKEVLCFEDCLEQARSIHRAGIENVMVSLGGRGALLVSREGEFTVKAPAVSLRSTVGAGDSSVAGFIAADLRCAAPREKLISAVAFGSAACMEEGTNPPARVNILGLIERIKAEKC